MRQRHLVPVVKTAVRVFEAVLILLIITLIISSFAVGLPDREVIVAYVVCLVVILTAELMSRKYFPVIPRVGRRERHTDTPLYKTIEHLLDTMTRHRPYGSKGGIVLVSIGTHWRPAVERYTLDAATAADDSTAGQRVMSVETITLSAQVPRLLHSTRVVPVSLDEGYYVTDKERLPKTAPIPAEKKSLRAALNLEVSTGLIWMPSSDLRVLAEQLKDAVPVTQ